MRSIKTALRVAGLSVAFIVGFACGDIGEVLLEQECFSDADCGPLNCVIPNPNNLNPAGLGWCLEGTTCAVGEQPYCPCGVSPGSSEPSCISPEPRLRMVQSTVACWDGVNPNTCLCLPPGVTCAYD